MSVRVYLDRERIAEFCEKWNIIELSIFGSVLRDDFGPHSDIDVLVSLAPHTGLGLFDWVQMIDELEGLFGRKVDLVEASTLRNPYRRKEILGTRQVLHEA
jgi:predicted nucleotidyltransferase